MSQFAGAAWLRQRKLQTRYTARTGLPPHLRCRIGYMSSQDVPKGKGERARPDRALLIAAEKVRIQYRNMPTAFVGSAMICSLMGFALAQGAGLAKVICWVAVVYTWVIARMIQWRAFNRINP